MDAGPQVRKDVMAAHAFLTDVCSAYLNDDPQTFDQAVDRLWTSLEKMRDSLKYGDSLNV